MEREHLLSAVLADDTRFAIYRDVAEHPGTPVTVADVAERFGLHPNVARMHLSKLEQAGFLSASLRKSGIGGRPARQYMLSAQVASFAFPPRRYDLLATLAMDVVEQTATQSEVVRICRDAGRADGRRFLTEAGVAPPLWAEAMAGAVRVIAESQGLLPEVTWTGDAVKIDVRNCVFREMTAGGPDLTCIMHRAFLEGVVDALTGGSGEASVVADGTAIRCGGGVCQLACSVEAAAGSGVESGG